MLMGDNIIKDQNPGKVTYLISSEDLFSRGLNEMFEDDFADKFLFGLIGGRVTLSSMNKPGDWGPPFAWEGLYFILIIKACNISES